MEKKKSRALLSIELKDIYPHNCIDILSIFCCPFVRFSSNCRTIHFTLKFRVMFFILLFQLKFIGFFFCSLNRQYSKFERVKVFGYFFFIIFTILNQSFVPLLRQFKGLLFCDVCNEKCRQREREKERTFSSDFYVNSMVFYMSSDKKCCIAKCADLLRQLCIEYILNNFMNRNQPHDANQTFLPEKMFTE